MAEPEVTRTRVGIVGAGPAGLLLSHLLHVAGIDSVVVDTRARHEIEHTHRAGILEQGSVSLLVDSGVSDRVLRDGRRHDGVVLRSEGESHRIDFQGLVGASTWLYPQTDVFIDLADARERDGGDVRFGICDTTVADITDDHPRILVTAENGRRQEIRCDVLVGADGSRSLCRHEVADRTQYSHEYPYAWFGVLVESPPSAPELVYNRSERGFALVSQRTGTVQRLYFQCPPTTSPEDWSEDRIFTELQARVAGPDGFRLHEGPVLEKTVLPFRSFVCEPMRHGSLVLVGDAAHTVPPTGAKGLNLALADVGVLAEVITDVVGTGRKDLLDHYSARALRRVWRAQHFSWWMTSMLHRPPDADAFDLRRQRGELESTVSSPHGSAWLAEAYTGWPS